MARIMNMDRCMNPRPVSIVVNGEAPVERGLFLEITGMAPNGLWLNGGDDFEAYLVELANAETVRGNLLIHTTVPKMYDERLVEADFVLEPGAVGRGHYVTVGDEITIAEDLINGEATVGAELALDADGKLKIGTGLAKVVKKYNWNGQPSVMIRFI